MVDGRGELQTATLADQLERLFHIPDSVDSLAHPAAHRDAMRLAEMFANMELLVIRRLVKSHAVGVTEVLGQLTLERHLTIAGLPASRARVLGRVVEWTCQHADTRHALLDGAVSVGQVDALARTAFDLVDEYERDEVELRGLAASLDDLDRFEMAVKAWRDRNDRAAADADTARKHGQRFLRMQPDLFGGGDLSGYLPAGDFQIAAMALETTPDPTDDPACEPRTLGQRTADAFVDICAESLGLAGEANRTHPASGNGNLTLPPSTDEPTGKNHRPVAVDVVLDIQAILGHDLVALEHVRRELGRAGLVPPSVAEQLCCDATFRRVIFDGPNKVINVGAPTAEIPRALRRAIQRRDKKCQFAGCDAHWTRCDVHHLIPREKNGPTNEANLVLLCRRHHTLTHQAGYHLARDPNSGEVLTWLPDAEADDWGLDQQGRWRKLTGPIEPRWNEPLRPNGRPSLS